LSVWRSQEFDTILAWRRKLGCDWLADTAAGAGLPGAANWHPPGSRARRRGVLLPLEIVGATGLRTDRLAFHPHLQRERKNGPRDGRSLGLPDPGAAVHEGVAHAPSNVGLAAG
jgi:hypothetical protein